MSKDGECLFLEGQNICALKVLLYSLQLLELFKIYFLVIHGDLENYMEGMYFLKCLVTYFPVLNLWKRFWELFSFTKKTFLHHLHFLSSLHFENVLANFRNKYLILANDNCREIDQQGNQVESWKEYIDKWFGLSCIFSDSIISAVTQR